MVLPANETRLQHAPSCAASATSSCCSELGLQELPSLYSSCKSFCSQLEFSVAGGGPISISYPNDLPSCSIYLRTFFSVETMYVNMLVFVLQSNTFNLHINSSLTPCSTACILLTARSKIKMLEFCTRSCIYAFCIIPPLCLNNINQLVYVIGVPCVQREAGYEFITTG